MCICCPLFEAKENKKLLYFLYFSQHNEEEETEAENFSKFQFFKMALFDLPLSVFDIFSDFAVGYALFCDSFSKNYGIISFCLNWVPGLVLFLHIFSKGPLINYVVLNYNFLTVNLFIIFYCLLKILYINCWLYNSKTKEYE